MVPISDPDLSIVIPAYNEELRLPRYLEVVTNYLQERGNDYELIVVDDGSSDGTANMVEESRKANPRLQLVRLPENCGKGAAVRAGMCAARGRLRLFADADGATPIRELERLEREIAGGADIAIGSRALQDETTKVVGKVHRKVMGTIFNLMVQTMAVPGIHDTQCGFKLFTSQAAAALFSLQRIDDFGFDVELLYLARKNGLRVIEVPVNWTDVSGTKVKVGRDSLKMFVDVVTIRLNELRGLYMNHAGGMLP